MIRFRRRFSLLLLAGLAAGAAVVTPLRAEDTKGKWQFGFGLSYMATTDYIRSNSDIAIASSVAGEQEGLPAVTFVDDRPDQNMLNEPTVQDDFRFDFSASYGLTRWLALEVSAGYMKSDVGNIEFYFKDVSINYGGTFPANPQTGSICGPNRNSPCSRYNINTPSAPPTNTFVPVGTLTEIPLQLSALVRFRPESPLDPYVGLGIGYLFTDLQHGDEFVRRGGGIADLTVAAEIGGEITDNRFPSRLAAPGTNGFTVGAMQAEVSSDFSWHAVGGIDYYVNDHFSVYVDARYTWTDAAVDITIDGFHQVLLATYAPGKLQTLRVDTPNEWEDLGLFGQSVGDHLIATEDGNGNGTFDEGVGEGAGILYLFPTGTNPNDPDCLNSASAACQWTAADAIQVIDCTNDTICPWRDDDTFSTEDLNGNRILDRFLYYGVDICSGVAPGEQANDICKPSDIVPTQQFVWPSNGCNTIQPQAVNGSFFPEGCPPGAPNGSDVSLAGSDDPSDTYIIQGGEIRLGGFSLGVGFKFTF